MSDSVKDCDDGRLTCVEQAIGHRFCDRSLLVQALTHPSAYEGDSASLDYERLEFLGDAVLGLIVVEELVRRFPSLGEGGMTKLKISVVSGNVLSETAEELGLAGSVVTGRSEEGTGARGRRSILENVYESLVGAVYLDGGLECARDVVLSTLGHRIDPESLGGLTVEHPKSALQEIVQVRGLVPVYRIVSEEGPPHDRSFIAEVSIDGIVAGSGSGRTKKEAETSAATQALASIDSP